MRKSIITKCLVFVSVMLTACYDEVDFDMISDEVSASPSLMLPLAKADVTVAYMFDEVENCIEYVRDEDGDERLLINSNHDSIAAFSLYDMLQIDADGVSFDYPLNLSSFSVAEMTSAGEDSVSLPIVFSIPIPTDVIQISSLDCDYQIDITCNDFTIRTNVTIDLGGSKSTFDVKKTSQYTTINATGKKMLISDNEIPVKMTLKVASDDAGSFGSMNIDLQIKRPNSITGIMNNLSFVTDQYINMTGLKNFNRLGKESQFRNPELFLSYTNNTDLHFDVTPDVVSRKNSTKRKTLDTAPFSVESRDIDKVITFDKENSNIASFFKDVPDSILYCCKVDASMAKGSSNVTIHSNDTLYLGYSYNIPVEFTISKKDVIHADTIDITDIPNLDDMKRSKLVVYAENSLPLSIGTKLVTYDSSTGQKYSSIEVEEMGRVPNIDANGKSTEKTTLSTTRELTREQMDDLSRSDGLIVQITLDTPDGRYVVPTSDNVFIFDVSLVAGFEINTND